MNFEKLKDTWHKENDTDLKLPSLVASLHSVLTPIDKIKKNMKIELYTQIISMFLIGFYPAIFKIEGIYFNLFYVIFGLLCVLSCYFMIQFFSFFSYINLKSLNSKDHLYEMYYELRIKTELYKTWTFAITPFSFLLIIILFLGKAENRNIYFDTTTIWLIGNILIIFFVLTIVLTHKWIQYFYGKHIQKIKTILEDLKEME